LFCSAARVTFRTLRISTRPSLSIHASIYPIVRCKTQKAINNTTALLCLNVNNVCDSPVVEIQMQRLSVVQPKQFQCENGQWHVDKLIVNANDAESGCVR
jgi:hypothetical protein